MRSIYNPQAYEKLPPATPARVWAALTDEKDPSKVLHHFLINPESIEWNRQANYDEAQIPLTDVAAQLYRNSTGRRLSLPEVKLEATAEGKSVQPQLDSLEKLLLPTDKLQPQVLCFAWGSRFIKPLILVNIRVRETMWGGGVPTSATVTLDFVEIPADKSQLSQAAQAKFKQGLTDRQKAEAKAAGAAEIKAKKSKLPATPKSKATAQKLALAVADDGMVTATDEKGELLGNVGRWNGKTLDTSLQVWVS